MNIYISKKDKNKLIEILKEFPFIDDYILDRERLGKEKFKIISNMKNKEIIERIATQLPNDSMIVDQIEYPGKDYLLCVGEINLADFSYLQKNDFGFSIITKKENFIRFNAWIHLSKINNVLESKKVNNFSAINGKIKEKTYFVFESTKNNIDDFYNIISDFSDEFIIRENNIFVKLLLKDFNEVYKKTKDLFHKMDIIDEDEF